MPLSPQQRMKQSAKQQEAAIRLSNVEKEARSTAKQVKKEVEQEEAGSTVPQWVIVAVAVAIFMSVVAQMYQSITSSPSMSR